MSFDRRNVLKALYARGFEFLREGGRHTILVRKQDGVTVAVPRHRDLNRFTIKGIAEDAGAEWQQFKREVS
jgi:predicted RNA binding protein YcfA (HicA-like mRNA interferase family)